MKNSITQLPEWQALEQHKQHIAAQRMQDWFAADPERFSRFSLQVDGILLDYSKNYLQPETLDLLSALAHKLDLNTKIEALFTGHAVNHTEKRPALHTALRDNSATPLLVAGENITPLIAAALEQMHLFTTQVRHGEWLGATGKPITDIVNIGMGGSHLGPLLTTQALADFADPKLRCHFISNIDPNHIDAVLRRINPETTLFIISSKSFNTLETLTNANTVKTWLHDKLHAASIAKPHFEKHFVAITAAPDKARAFGIPDAQIFPLWDWIGGRYSVWSAMGLPFALLIGMENFQEFLRGAHAMDLHFRYTDFSKNMPVIMALLGIWYINFFAARTHAIVPYDHSLTHLRTYLQQADMESNGKSVIHDGETTDYATGPIIWGEQGIHAQHAFLQLLHQGQHLVPVDFIISANKKNNFANHQNILVASCLSQAQALMQGKTFQQTLTELLTAGYDKKDAETLARHKTIAGNRPSNILFIDKINPYHLGALLALYEHKIYAQSVIWQINSFDQWGVELGKELLPQILAALNNSATLNNYDSSTQGLIRHYKSVK